MNENCCFCSGSGYIDGPRTMTPAVPMVKIKRVESKAEQRFEQRIAKPGKLALPLERQCPHCPQMLSSGKKLTHHIISKHASLVKIFRCSNCSKPFLEEFAMKSHLRFCRMKKTRTQSVGKRAVQPEVKQRDPRGSGPRPNEPKSVYQDPKKERQRDGSRDFHKFRDQGRFGSHSSHDDYGDDSNS